MSDQRDRPNVLESHAKFLAEAFANLLGDAARGTITFVRCLGREVIDGLCASTVFHISGWEIRAVVDHADRQRRYLTAGEAIELREEKREVPVLFLVDSAAAGAGMDGIYNASREIKEAELFEEAGKVAARSIRHGWTTFARSAVKQANRLGGRRGISPWREFDFLTRCAVNADDTGRSLSRLGLWPIKTGSKPNTDDLGLSASIVEGLLIGAPASRTAQAKIDALMLDNPSTEVRNALERFIRDAAAVPFDEAMLALADQPSLWLNEIRLTSGAGQLRRLTWSPWKGKGGRVGKWSGLIDNADDLPHFVMNPDASAAKDISRLEVHWETEPEDLGRGSVEYRVTVVAGEDELADKIVSHNEKSPQKAVFTNEDFIDLDDDARFEAKLRIVAIGVDGIPPVESDEFLLFFSGETTDNSVTAGAGKVVRTAVEGAINLGSIEDFDASCARTAAELFVEDKRGYIIYRPQPGRGGYRIPRPPLIKAVEESWALRSELLGRWVVRVRADGSPVGPPSFVEIGPEGSPEELRERVAKASKRFCEELMQGPGAIAHIYCAAMGVAEEYLNAWSAILEKSSPEASLAHTVEIQSLSGRTIGLVVLPTHPLRVAWHMGYDQLARHARYTSNMSAAEVKASLAVLDSAQFPSILPGLAPNHSFVFGDTLGFHAVAMVRDDDCEPKAAISQIAACLAKDQPEIAPSVGAQAADVLAREIRKYVDYHDVQRLLLVHALHPGDGLTLGRALGQVAGGDDQQDEMGSSERRLGFVVELFAAEMDRGQTGRFFTEVLERRRSGAGGFDPRDRWMLESLACEGGITLPRLRWAKRGLQLPDTAAHISVAFDTFASHVEGPVLEDSESPRPLHAYGLSAHLERRWQFSDVPTWVSYQPQQTDGEKHPAGKVLTDRINRIHRAVLQSAAVHIGGEGEWPAFVTRLSPDKRSALSRLHHLSDWVITVDRNAGIEYFDSPRESGAVYDAYVIDCVPERDDLGSLQLITSTIRVEEVQALLNETLGEMGLSSSPGNCRFLLAQLKAISGRLAIRLTNPNVPAGELVALATVHANCLRAPSSDDQWLAVQHGFFVPLDDVRDLNPPSTKRKEAEHEEHRADLLFVSAGGRGGLRLAFIEVKYRRHLAEAADPTLVRTVVAQADGTARRWHEWYFTPSLPDVARNLRRSRLARALRFYADKARRHHLLDDSYRRVLGEIDKMVRTGGDYAFASVSVPNRGYIFCPEFGSDAAKEMPSSQDSLCRVFLFGPDVLPEVAASSGFPTLPTAASPRPSVTDESVTESEPSNGNASNLETAAGQLQTVQAEDALPESDAQLVEARVTAVPAAGNPTDGVTRSLIITLGERIPAGESVSWPVSIKANPHLMIVGLPGMGKTTFLVNLCRQFAAGGVTPIVFSYHQDLDEKLAASLDGLRFLDHASLGFNPLRLEDTRPLAYVDTAGMMRDIFAAIFPEMGDIQASKIRTAIKDSYEALGWGPGVPGRAVPEFRDFFLRLQGEEKPDKGLLARLTELNDYGVFSGTGDGRRLLDDTAPAVVQVHANQNEVIQRAFASLVFYGLYKDMFRRGTQGRITHAIIFDEAHRASKLRLLPTMAKECRKYGISLILASQEARDFDESLYSAVANYLALHVTENDARAIARHCVDSDLKNHTADRLKALPRYEALFFSEGKRRPIHTRLTT